MSKKKRNILMMSLLTSVVIIGAVLFANNNKEELVYYSEPDKVIELSSELNEISGLCVVNRFTLAAINDEKGIIYVLNAKTGKIKKKIKFSGSGDYEGIAKVDNHYYIVSSKGDIYDYNTKSKKTKKYNTPLSLSNDIEGLCYDPIENDLLLAVKGKSTIKDNKKNYSSIYRFSLKKKKLDKKPFIKVNYKEIEQQLDRDLKHHLGPSGIEIYNGQYYIISSISKVLMIYDFELNLIESHNLDPKFFTQPEGICFLNDKMYISNEKHSKTPTLLVYDLKK